MTLLWNRRTVLAAGLAASCSPRRAATHLRLGFQKSGVPYLAKARGVVEAAIRRDGGGRVEWIEFQSGPPLMEALNAGAIDLGAVGECAPIFAQAAGNRFLYVAEQPVTGANQALLAPSNAPIRTVADLAGKRIAFVRGSSAHLFLADALASAGLTLDQIVQIPLNPADAASAFAGGSIDGWVIWDPFYSLAVGRGGARVILDGVGLPRTSNFYVATPDFAEQNPTTLKRLLTIYAEEAVWANSNLPEAARILSEATGLGAEALEASMRRGPLGCRPLMPDTIANQQRAAATLASIKVIPSLPRIEERVWDGWSGAA